MTLKRHSLSLSWVIYLLTLYVLCSKYMHCGLRCRVRAPSGECVFWANGKLPRELVTVGWPKDRDISLAWVVKKGVWKGAAEIIIDIFWRMPQEVSCLKGIDSRYIILLKGILIVIRTPQDEPCIIHSSICSPARTISQDSSSWDLAEYRRCCQG